MLQKRLLWKVLCKLLSVRGTKDVLHYSKEHSVGDSLNYISTWNAAMLLSEDLTEAFKATMEKRPPKFND